MYKKWAKVSSRIILIKIKWMKINMSYTLLSIKYVLKKVCEQRYNIEYMIFGKVRVAVDLFFAGVFIKN